MLCQPAAIIGVLCVDSAIESHDSQLDSVGLELHASRRAVHQGREQLEVFRYLRAASEGLPISGDECGRHAENIVFIVFFFISSFTMQVLT